VNDVRCCDELSSLVRPDILESKVDRTANYDMMVTHKLLNRNRKNKSSKTIKRLESKECQKNWDLKAIKHRMQSDRHDHA
jgi:hypothetical protein